MDISDLIDDGTIEEDYAAINYLNSDRRQRVVRERPDNMSAWDDKQFHRRFRLEKDTLQLLLTLIGSKIANTTNSSKQGMVIMDIKEPIGTLEEQALKRKERLKSLKRKNPENSAASSNEVMVLPKPKFRSYKPQDETLQESKLQDAEPAVVEEEVKDLLEAGKEKVVLQDLDISSLAPRKPDWDLKRDVAKKLEKLERRTQKAIAELIWERLKQGNEDNIGALVTMTDNRANEDD